MVRQIAVVRLAPETELGEVVYADHELSEAVKYVEENTCNLPPGYHFDIYYRHEEDER